EADRSDAEGGAESRMKLAWSPGSVGLTTPEASNAATRRGLVATSLVAQPVDPPPWASHRYGEALVVGRARGRVINALYRTDATYRRNENENGTDGWPGHCVFPAVGQATPSVAGICGSEKTDSIATEGQPPGTDPLVVRGLSIRLRWEHRGQDPGDA